MLHLSDEDIIKMEIEHIADNHNYLDEGFDSYEEMLSAIETDVMNRFDEIKEMYYNEEIKEEEDV